MSTDQTTEMTAEEWIATRPEVTAFAPSWVNQIDASDDGVEGHVALSFDRLEGSVEIGSAATWYDGEITQKDPGVYVYFKRNESRVTAADLRLIAEDFVAAADALEGRADA